MVSKNGLKCIKIEGVVADSSTAVDEGAASLNAVCTLLSVQDTATASML